jgi:hypothetical protein
MLRWRSARRHIFREKRLMDDAMIAGHLENLDRRLTRVEQILPTLATRDESHAALATAVAALATKEDLRFAIAPLATKENLRLAIAPLATKEELRLAIAPLATKEELREEGERSRRHMDIVGEALRSDIQLLAEHLAAVKPKPRDADVDKGDSFA